MCGLLGVSKIKGINIDDILLCMKEISSINYRGPDNTNTVDLNNNVFSQCRLSIVDRCERSNQPFINRESGNLIIFNGEIYNHNEIRGILTKEGITFNTKSDTEVILKAFEFWNEDFIDKLRGMFAIAIYSPKLNKIILTRDPLGEKPLFFYNDQDQFCFASELKPLANIINKKLDFNYEQLSYFLNCGYTYQSNTLISGLKQVKPGTLLIYDTLNGEIKNKRFWNLEKVGLAEQKSEENLIDDIYNLIEESIGEQLSTEVPLGFLFSGGLDSSILLAIGSRLRKDIKSFTVSFKDNTNNADVENACEVARGLKVDHTVVEGDEYDIKSVIDILEKLDNPTGDPAILPTHQLCKLIKRYCTVAIVGDGADELFGGYNHINRSYLVSTFRERFGFFLPNGLNILLKVANISDNNKYSNVSKILKNKIPLYPGIIDNSHKKDIFKMDLIPIKEEIGEWQKPYNVTERMLKYDLNNFLPNDILFKSDRASMLSSLEVRCPYIDKRICDYMLSNLSYFAENGLLYKKNILKKIASEKLNLSFYNRSKLGFLPPICRIFSSPEDRNFAKKYLIDSGIAFEDKFSITKLLLDSSKSYKCALRSFELLSLAAWMNNFKNNIIY